MARIEKTVFISYRRKDISWALAVYQYLTGQNYDVFFDYTSLSGGDFEQVIVSNIKARAHFVLILTPTALDRCNEPGDWLRREIEAAVDERRNIIPLFFDGFSFGIPSVAQKLTGKLSSINRYNGLDVPAGYFLEAMDRLSNRYLNVPLDAVIHPVPTEVRKMVQDQQAAANMALIRKSEEIKEIARPVEKVSGERKRVKTATPSPYTSGRQISGVSQRSNSRIYSIGVGVLLVLVAGGTGIVILLSSIRGGTNIPTETSQIITTAIPVEPSATLYVDNTATIESGVPIGADVVVTVSSSITVLPDQGVSYTKISSVDGETLISIPPGSFMMGLTDEQTNVLRLLCNATDCEGLYQASKPAHEVELTKGYWIYQTEVSNAQYAGCVNSGICAPPISNSSAGHGNYFDNPSFADYPVVWIDWNRAATYCKWIGGRLPTSAEWEYAARGVDGRLFPWGNDVPDGGRANVNNLFGVATAINSFTAHPSPFGVLNMTGNVWEWVSDWYSPTYYRDNTNWADPKGPQNGDLKVGRGGSWWIRSAISSIAIQDWEEPNSANSYDSVGFRCAMDIE